MHDTLPDDPWHLATTGRRRCWPALIAKGALGQKTKAGFFRKIGKDIQVLDPARADYRASDGRRRPGGGRRSSRSSIPGEKFAKLRAHRASAGAVPVGDLPRPLPLQRLAPRGDRRQRARRRPRDPLGLRLEDGSVRDLAGRRLAAGRRLDRRGHRRRQGAGEGAAAGVGERRPGRGRRARGRGRVQRGREQRSVRARRCRSTRGSSSRIRCWARRRPQRHDDLRERRRAHVAPGRRHRASSRSRAR